MAVTNHLFVEEMQIISGFPPVDMQTATNTGDWINMALYGRLAFIVFKGVGTGGDDPVITLNQASDNAGTGSKGLNFTRIDKKVATLLTAAAAGTFTTTTQAAAATYTATGDAAKQAIYVIDVLAESLDVANGFNHVQLNVADVGGNAQLGCCLVLAAPARFGTVPLLTAID